MAEKRISPANVAVSRVLLLHSSAVPEIASAAEQLLPLVAQHAQVQVVDLGQNQDLSQVEFDLAVVLGGDGSILRAAHQMGRRQRPVVGVNLGRLGFLADLLPDEFAEQLPAICAGALPITEHLMYECQVQRDGKVLRRDLGLNEVAIFAGPPFAILDVHLYVDSELVTTYSCDGLIISTPVGSTAHSLSAGGPILRQDLQAFVILPVSPHTLTNRPVVDSADRVYELVVSEPHAGTSVVADGRVLTVLKPGDRVRVERAEARFKLVTIPGHSYYRTLRDKLGWGGRLRADENAARRNQTS